MKPRIPVKDIADLLEEDGTTVAVVGASDDSSKYGYVIYRDLKRKGFTVYAVNPNSPSVDGDKTFPRLSDLPVTPTIVNVVVPPEVTLDILEQCLRLELLNVWLQPGAEDPHVLTFLQQHGFNYLANSCIMVASRLKG